MPEVRCPACRQRLSISAEPGIEVHCPHCQALAPVASFDAIQATPPAPRRETGIQAEGPVPPRMELVSCPHCARKIAEVCRTCPFCERPLGEGEFLPRPKATPWRWLLAEIGGSVLALWLLVGLVQATQGKPELLFGLGIVVAFLLEIGLIAVGGRKKVGKHEFGGMLELILAGAGVAVVGGCGLILALAVYLLIVCMIRW